MRTPSTGLLHARQRPFEKEWKISLAPVARAPGGGSSTVSLGSMRGSLIMVGSRKDRQGTTARRRDGLVVFGHARKHGGIGESRIAFAVEDVVRARRDVRPVDLGDADRTLH